MPVLSSLPSRLAQAIYLNNWPLFQRLLGLSLSAERCRLCLGSSAHTAICAACLADLPWLSGAKQQRSLLGGSLQGAFSYESPINLMITGAKYRREVGLSALLGHLLASYVHPASIDSDLLIPVPMPWPRLLWRGHNHVVPMAQAMSSVLGVPLNTQLLVRKGWQRPQKGLSRKARLSNLAQAFQLNEDVAGRAVILIDDVSTTGATIETAARVLLAGGARKVDALVVALRQ
jgi:ComF family protein